MSTVHFCVKINLDKLEQAHHYYLDKYKAKIKHLPVRNEEMAADLGIAYKTGKRTQLMAENIKYYSSGCWACQLNVLMLRYLPFNGGPSRHFSAMSYRQEEPIVPDMSFSIYDRYIKGSFSSSNKKASMCLTSLITLSNGFSLEHILEEYFKVFEYDFRHGPYSGQIF